MSSLEIVRRPPPKWFSWRDVVSLLLGVTVLLLVLQVNGLRKELDQRPTAAQLDQISHQLTLTRQSLAIKDARIRQLTDLLIRNRIPVPPEPKIPPEPAPMVRPSPTPAPSPSPGRSSSPRPRPTRSPSASPSPSCLVFIENTCLTPPPRPPFIK